MATVKTECSACGGTGVYSGFAEPKGTGVVCLQCDGTGCHEIQYKPFKKRKLMKDIEVVRLSRGTFIATGVGPAGKEIRYAEFLKGKMP